ncbi:MAG: efflux transporter, ATP-binding protein [Symbiobacteriaceae bacterium]|jgi:ABC-2 type transport system ATP-binding protein|nr:efflux transporter, ATP-binding protein [Symbiobacteriaceae bacterium]
MEPVISREPVISVTNLSKTYQNGARALDDVSLKVQPGEIFCLLGPNGAGKTTLVRILATQLLPSAGKVSVLGQDAIAHPELIREDMAIVPQEGRPGQDLNAWDYVYWYLRARGMVAREAAARTEATLKEMGLWEIRRTMTAKLSGGLRRRVLIAMAVATGAKLLFLDEPTVGLDPEARVATWDLIARLRKQATVVLTTHLMDEVEALADRIGILAQGRLVAMGTARELSRFVPSKTKVVLGEGLELPWLAARGEVAVRGRQVAVYPFDEAATREIIDRASSNGVSFAVAAVGLEDVYLRVVKEHGEVVAS